MNLTCIIVEDEPLARNLLTQYVLKTPSLSLLQAFSNPLEALAFLRNNPTDILFSDIQMPEITGITLLKVLPKKPIVILTTAYSEYAIEGYELDVTDYLLKPITFERFLKSVEKARQRLSSAQNNEQTEEPKPYTEGGQIESSNSENTLLQPYIFVKDGTKLVKVRLNDILYIEGLKDYVAIFTKQKKIVSLQRMKVLETQLPDNQFIRIHNSYLVSLEAIDVIHKEKVQIGDVYLPISDTYRKAFREFIERNNIRLD
ncbi:MAG: response regulator transcription factor [Saprospiraceae bacterium]|nr:response regulator transcription factor [Saprospiraceae bacterium]